MTDSDRFSAVLALARAGHEGQYRMGGLPYITHPEGVAQMLRMDGYDIDHQLAGLCHDLLEDTHITPEQIEAAAGERVLQVVKLLTKEQGYVMEEYIARIKVDPMARAVKAADRLHNLRSAVVAGEDFKRKYILESVAWYLDFSPQIPEAVLQLAQTLDGPPPDCSFFEQRRRA